MQQRKGHQHRRLDDRHDAHVFQHRPPIAAVERVLLSDRLLTLPYGVLVFISLTGIVIVREWYTLTLDNDNLWVALPGVLLTTVIGLSGVLIVAFAYWSALITGARLKPFVLGGVALTVAVGFSMEAFAGLSWLLWRHDVIDLQAHGELSLWQMEHLLLWNTADAVPLLEIPSAMSWERPVVVSGTWAGVILVGFRVAILVPIIALGALAIQGSQDFARREFRLFRDEEWNVIQVEQRELLDTRWDRFVFRVTRGAAGICVVAVVSAIVAASFTIRFLITIGVEADSSWLRYWLDAPAHRSFVVPISGREVRPTWLLNVGDVGASLLVTAIVVVAIFFLGAALLLPLAVGPLPWRLGAVAASCALVLLVCQALAAISISFINLGVAEPVTYITTGREYQSALEWFEWNAAKLAPVVDVPSTTNWSLSNPFKDRWIGALTILLRLSMVIMVFWPVSLLVGMTVEEFKLRSAGTPEM